MIPATTCDVLVVGVCDVVPYVVFHMLSHVCLSIHDLVVTWPPHQVHNHTQGVQQGVQPNVNKLQQQ